MKSLLTIDVTLDDGTERFQVLSGRFSYYSRATGVFDVKPGKEEFGIIVVGTIAMVKKKKIIREWSSCEFDFLKCKKIKNKITCVYDKTHDAAFKYRHATLI